MDWLASIRLSGKGVRKITPRILNTALGKYYSSLWISQLCESLVILMSKEPLLDAPWQITHEGWGIKYVTSKGITGK